MLQRDGAVPTDTLRAFPEVEQFRFPIQVQETVSLVSHVALYAQDRSFRGPAVEAFMPRPNHCGQVPHKALHVYHHLRVWDGHSVYLMHMLEVRCEADIVVCEALAAKQTLEG